MRAVFDTNILIDYLNGHENARKELELYEDRWISIITWIEVLVGAKSDNEKSTIERFLSTFNVAELSTDIAQKTVRLRKESKLRIPDAVVYATARTMGCLLVTRDSKDLNPEWPDVRVPYRL